jgi:hypothetical protein
VSGGPLLAIRFPVASTMYTRWPGTTITCLMYPPSGLLDTSNVPLSTRLPDAVANGTAVATTERPMADCTTFETTALPAITAARYGYRPTIATPMKPGRAGAVCSTRPPRSTSNAALKPKASDARAKLKRAGRRTVSQLAACSRSRARMSLTYSEENSAPACVRKANFCATSRRACA